MNSRMRCLAAGLGLALLCGSGLAVAGDAVPDTGETPALAQPPAPATPRAEQRRADRAVLTLQQDALGRVLRTQPDRQAGSPSPRDPEITRSPTPPAPTDTIRL